MNNLNPVKIIDALLAEWASAKVRRTIHLLLMLAFALVTLYLAAEGDWVEALIGLAGTAYTASNGANTPTVENEDDFMYDTEVEDGDYLFTDEG